MNIQFGFWHVYSSLCNFQILWNKNDVNTLDISHNLLFRRQGIVFLLDCAFYNRRVSFHVVHCSVS